MLTAKCRSWAGSVARDGVRFFSYSVICDSRRPSLHPVTGTLWFLAWDDGTRQEGFLTSVRSGIEEGLYRGGSDLADSRHGFGA